jgi:hypothetical protein
MTTTSEFTRPKAYAAPQPGDLGAGADIFRRMDRRQRKSGWKTGVPIAVLAACAVGGVAAYMAMSRPHPAPKPAPAPAVAAPAAAPVGAAPAASAPAASAPAAAPAKLSVIRAPAAVHPSSPRVHRQSLASRHEARAARAAVVGEDVNTSASVPAPASAQPPVVSAPPASPPVAPSAPATAPTPMQAAPSSAPTTPPQ